MLNILNNGGSVAGTDLIVSRQKLVFFRKH